MKNADFNRGPGVRSSTGAALLAFILVLILSSTWLLLSDLNGHTQAYVRRADTELALSRAKQALLHYAMNYPDLRDNPDKGPGFLPCPDRNNDGRPESNCALSTGTTLGRLPFTILGLDDPRDSSGERLWYALSPDFKNSQSNQALINSETPGQLSVDGVNDVVAVVIAPGAPVSSQYARPGNAAADYLEGDNANISDSAFSTTAGNDQLAIITRADLMSVVEQRVVNEMRAVLARYRAEHSAYPWLTPFADPHADNRVLRGSHTGNNDATLLTDRRKDFNVWGVSPNDLVRNVTDGSIAVVKEVNQKTLEVVGHGAGMENDFDKGDMYFIERRGLAHTLSGTATAGSRDFTLNDSNRDFKELGIVPGDVIENLSDGSSGTISAVHKTAITVRRLTGGIENDFDFGELYRLRANTGVAAPGSLGLTLVDPRVDFIARGIVNGDVVENLSDRSVGRVDSVGGPTMLTVSGLYFGRINQFRANDVYRLPRFNAGNHIRKGLLSVHEPGKRFPTGFQVEWRVPVLDRYVITGFTPDTHSGYAAAVTQSLQSSAPAGSINANRENGHCIWLNAQVVECTGASVATPLLDGTANPGSSASVLVDGAQDFISAGIKPGDLIEQPHVAVVTRVTSSTVLNLGQLAPTPPGPAEGEYYRIRAATRSMNGTAGAPGSDRLQDLNRNFSVAGVLAGDIVENATDGSFGLVTGVSGSDISTTLYGGGDNSFQAGDEYNVYYAYVNRRRYRFNLRYQGDLAIRSAGGIRQRDVCRGYGTDCAGAPVAATLPHHEIGVSGQAGSATTGLTLEDTSANFLQLGVVPGDTLFNTTDGSVGMVEEVNRHFLTNGALDGGHDNEFEAGDAYRISRPMLIIEDLRDASTVTRTGLTVPPGGAPGSIRTNGIDYYLSESPGELPAWFIKNKWHHLLYIAYSSGFAPAGGGLCTAESDCLVIQDHADDTEALVVSAGMALAGQDRSTGSITDYYEGENATLSGDDIFTRAGTNATFNDQLAVAAP